MKTTAVVYYPLHFLVATVEVPLPVECEAYTNYQSLVASGYSADAIAWVYRQFNFDDVPLEVLTVKLGTLDVVDSKIKKSGDCGISFFSLLHRNYLIVRRITKCEFLI